ncbi:DNA-directed RNA polymerase II subunit RPB1-like [Malaya genurostris]|uniref:DNA-directed RNA polymerase II subunit RPB1-like n=1 Tax=Malaya genurostris TaxID=325434 RepID=UPI0026F3CA4F|nr:DNA-directed RNA polymerase II subunit RPB1-like [Malaya genurostris]
MMFFRITAILLLSVSALAAKESQSKSTVKSSSAKISAKGPHGKREVASEYGPMEFIAPTISGFTYGMPQPLFNIPHYTGYRYYSSPYKFSQPSLFSPASQQDFHTFPNSPVKYSISSKELSEIIKALQSPNPALTIRAVPTSSGWDNTLGYDPTGHYKSPTLKFHETLPSTYGIPHSTPSNSYLPANYAAHPNTADEPLFANGVKGVRHYASSSNSHVPDLYTGNKYISAIKPLYYPAQAVSQLHTNIHTQKPFKPSTYLGSTNEISDYSHSQPATSSSFHNAYLAPALQYLPPKVDNKVTYEQPTKSYLPPVQSKPTNSYLPPKPSNTYLTAAPSNPNYISISSHENDGKQYQHYHSHSLEESNESIEYSGSHSTTAKPHHHPWQP